MQLLAQAPHAHTQTLSTHTSYHHNTPHYTYIYARKDMRGAGVVLQRPKRHARKQTTDTLHTAHTKHQRRATTKRALEYLEGGGRDARLKLEAEHSRACGLYSIINRTSTTKLLQRQRRWVCASVYDSRWNRLHIRWTTCNNNLIILYLCAMRLVYALCAFQRHAIYFTHETCTLTTTKTTSATIERHQIH